MRFHLCLVLLTLPLAAMADTRVLVLGDSILAWNRSNGNSIPQLLGRVPGLRVESRAAVGAVFSNAGGAGGLFRGEIRAQLPRGRWDVIILDGGGNDLARACGCNRCDNDLNRLVSPDGQSGEIPAFLDLLSQRANRVIWLDYYPVSVRGGPFAACQDEFAVLEHRMKAAAARRASVRLVDAGDVYDPRDMTLYARDLVHPTPRGGARIATQLLRAIRD